MADIGVVTGILRLQDQFTGTLTRASAALSKSGKQMQAVGRQMSALGGSMTTAITLPLAIIGGVAIKTFADFDDAMTRSLAIMGDVTDALEKDMVNAARKVAVETSFSAEQAAESYFFLASAGLDAAQSIAALPQVAAFAQAGMFDMALATDLLTDAQSALGLTMRDDVVKNMENMARVSDVLVKANTLANATVQQFSQALTTEAGAALKSFNIDIEEGVAVLAAFADQGVKSEKAGTGLSRILRLMTAAAVKNKKAYQEFNVTVFDSRGKIRNLADIIGDLETAMGTLSDEARTAALSQLGFKARVQGVILPLLGTSQAIRDYEAALRDAGGITEEVAEKQLKSFTQQMKLLKDSMIDAFITLGESLAPSIKGFADNVLVPAIAGMARLAEAFAKLPDPMKNVIIALAATLAAAGPVLLIAGQLVVVFGGIALAFGSAAAGWIAAGVALVAVAVSLLAAFKPVRDFVVLFVKSLFVWVDAIKMAIAIMREWWDQTVEGRRFLSELADVIAEDVSEAIASLISKAQIAAEIISLIRERVMNVVSAFIEWTGISATFRENLAAAVVVVNALRNAINAVTGALFDWIGGFEGLLRILAAATPGLNLAIGQMKSWADEAKRNAESAAELSKATEEVAKKRKEMAKAISPDALGADAMDEASQAAFDLADALDGALSDQERVEGIVAIEDQIESLGARIEALGKKQILDKNAFADAQKEASELADHVEKTVEAEMERLEEVWKEGVELAGEAGLEAGRAWVDQWLAEMARAAPPDGSMAATLKAGLAGLDSEIETATRALAALKDGTKEAAIEFEAYQRLVALGFTPGTAAYNKAFAEFVKKIKELEGIEVEVDVEIDANAIGQAIGDAISSVLAQAIRDPEGVTWEGIGETIGTAIGGPLVGAALGGAAKGISGEGRAEFFAEIEAQFQELLKRIDSLVGSMQSSLGGALAEVQDVFEKVLTILSETAELGRALGGAFDATNRELEALRNNLLGLTISGFGQTIVAAEEFNRQLELMAEQIAATGEQQLQTRIDEGEFEPGEFDDPDEAQQELDAATQRMLDEVAEAISALPEALDLADVAKRAALQFAGVSFAMESISKSAEKLIADVEALNLSYEEEAEILATIEFGALAQAAEETSRILSPLFALWQRTGLMQGELAQERARLEQVQAQITLQRVQIEAQLAGLMTATLQNAINAISAWVNDVSNFLVNIDTNIGGVRIPRGGGGIGRGGRGARTSMADLLEQFEDFMNRGLKGFVKSVKSLVDEFEDARKKFKRIPGALKKINALFKKEFRQMLSDWADIPATVGSGLRQLRDEFLAFSQAAKDAGISQAEVNQRYRQALANFWETVLGPLRENLRESLLSDISPLRPGSQFALLRERFESLVGRGLGGDIEAIGQVGGARDDLLRMAAELWGTSSAAFRNLFESTMEDAERLLGRGGAALSVDATAQVNATMEVRDSVNRVADILMGNAQQGQSQGDGQGGSFFGGDRGSSNFNNFADQERAVQQRDDQVTELRAVRLEMERSRIEMEEMRKENRLAMVGEARQWQRR